MVVVCLFVCLLLGEYGGVGFGWGEWEGFIGLRQIEPSLNTGHQNCLHCSIFRIYTFTIGQRRLVSSGMRHQHLNIS